MFAGQVISMPSRLDGAAVAQPAGGTADGQSMRLGMVVSCCTSSAMCCLVSVPWAPAMRRTVVIASSSSILRPSSTATPGLGSSRGAAPQPPGRQRPRRSPLFPPVPMCSLTRQDAQQRGCQRGSPAALAADAGDDEDSSGAVWAASAAGPATSRSRWERHMSHHPAKRGRWTARSRTDAFKRRPSLAASYRQSAMSSGGA
mmetsp:Transcript_3568/g.9957  ORF Transcript_3568/g.9957 Transcript_3568/m.9957 type:complete len:201 (-) Transcript_3568:459-1061(-)